MDNLTVFAFVLIIGLLSPQVHSQISQTVCTPGGTECAALPNSICDQFNTLTCVCSSAQKYQAKPDNSGCDYNCGALTNPTNGAVSTSGTLQTSVATYTCSTGFMLTGASTRTCVLGSEWSGVAPTCVAGMVGDSCATVTNLCVNLINAPCTVGTCLNGYTQSTDSECVEINECGSSPCKFGTTCINGIANFTCTCATGYNGTQCEINSNYCLSEPCQNGGACTDGLATYTCSCAAGFTGATCATNINECSSTPCQNGATCNDGIDGYTCSCVAGFTGIHCETNINECSSNPSTNGATCNDLMNLYTCDCATGYTGPTCASDINECASNPCQNLGTCHDRVNGFNCTCVSGYNGHVCQNIGVAYDQECSETADCDTTGATCRNDGLEAYRCLCTPSGEIYVTSSDKCLKECGYLKNPTNGQVTLPANTTEGQMASYLCIVGYVLSGPKFRTCQSNGKWNDAEPACIFDSRPDTTVPFGVMIAMLGLFDLVVVAVYIKHRCRGRCKHRIYTNRSSQQSNFDSELYVTNSMQYSAKHRDAEKAKRGSVRSPRTGSEKSIRLSNYIGY